MKQLFGIILIVMLGWSGGPQPVFAMTTIVMSSDDSSPYSTIKNDGFVDLVMQEAFRRLGINLKIVRLSSERAILNADSGVEDGNYSRIAGLTAIYPNLIQVPESVTKFEFVAVSTGLKFPTTKWESLNPYNIGIITGWKILEQNIIGTKSLTKAEDEHILFKLLKLGRVDCVVYDRRQALVEAKHEGIENPVILQPPLAVRDMYPYLHKKHQALVPRLAEAIRTMKADGSYEAIVSKVLARYGKNL